jgi:hypothetical protein
MDSVIIVTRRSFEFEQLRQAIPATYRVDDAGNDRVVIESGGRRAYLGPDARIVDEMEPEEASRIADMIPEPIFYTLDFSDISLGKELLVAIADRGDVVIDNDHGVVLSGSEFVRLLRSHGDWDWRRAHPS